MWFIFQMEVHDYYISSQCIVTDELDLKYRRTVIFWDFFFSCLLLLLTLKRSKFDQCALQIFFSSVAQFWGDPNSSTQVAIWMHMYFEEERGYKLITHQ